MDSSTVRRHAAGRLVCVVAFSIMCAGAYAQVRAPAPPPPPASLLAQTAGTGVITGVITASDTGRPLRRTRVMLTNSETNANLGTAVTDVEGRFTFDKLPAAPLTLKASKAGYLDAIYGQKKSGSGRAGTSIQLADAQKIENLQLQLSRGGVISGIVVDEVGDPVFGVPVRVMRYVMRNGTRELTAVGKSGESDDRGQYRVSGLVPGEYVVCAVPLDELVFAAAQYESLLARMNDIRAANAARGTVDPNLRDLSSFGAAPADPKDAYVRMCVPGTTRMTEATSVTLDVGEERPGQNIQLQLLPIARVSGTVSWGGGKMPIASASGGTTADTQVQLVDPSVPDSAGAMRVIHVKADGVFSFNNVPPGQYRLEAHADVPMADPAPVQPGQRPPPPVMTPLWASEEIVVSGQSIANANLAMAHGMTVSGRVQAEGATPIDLSRLSVTALPAGPMYGEFSIPPAKVESDGRFTITGVVPGRYRIGLARGAAGAVIKSAVFSGADTLDFPMEVKPGVDVVGGLLTAVPRFAEISGVLQDAANKPVPGFTVIAFPLDPRYWTPASRRIQAGRPATDGRFTLRNLPAGEYRLVAVTDVETGEWFDPAFLKTLMGGATAVTLTEGERKEQPLRIVR
jgi:hypothetical protein